MAKTRRSRDVVGTGLPPTTPFQRLSRVHSLMTAGDTAMAVALADSLFLSISPDAARTKVLLFLAVSMAPFAVVAPLVGPFVDRMKGGQRMVVVLVGVLRAFVLVGMASSLDSLTLFPLAFAALILGKTYAIAKSAIVPTTVNDESKFVESNSKLGQISGITGFVVAGPVAALQLIDTRAALGLGVIAFLAASLNAYRLPKMAIQVGQSDAREKEELHSPSIVAASIAMRTLRFAVGFMFFHLAFWLRKEIAGTAWFGLAIGLSGLATLGANFAGPYLRRRMRVEMMLFASLVFVVLIALFATWYDRVVGGIVLVAAVNAAAAIGRLAFEATVQRDAPDANRGKVFARFETQNQIAWVCGGLIPVIISPSGWLGFAGVVVISSVGAVLFWRAGGIVIGSRGGRARGQEHQPRSE
ncbi:MAG: MFS transporter [Actinobacteria bacterium]|nr:MFS transporter [Actinomycetota bacterium]